jgi:hypothetical protein
MSGGRSRLMDRVAACLVSFSTDVATWGVFRSKSLFSDCQRPLVKWLGLRMLLKAVEPSNCIGLRSAARWR